MLLLPTFLAACLIQQDRYEARKQQLTDHDGDGFVLEDDCDDADATVFPDAEERCDGLDQDCDAEVDEDAVDAPVWFADADEDGHGDATLQLTACDAPYGYVSAADDCDDTDATVFPGAADPWYDGVDANCDGADDFDADADGDPSEDHRGTDCDDTDPTISGSREEGWYDAGVDNDCDGSVEDQAAMEVGDASVLIAGDTPGAEFGATVLALPPGWADDEAVLLAAAPFSGPGDVYGWTASALGTSPSLATARWRVTGEEATAYLGYGMAWAGSPASPRILVGAEGARDSRGSVDVWSRSEWGSSPGLTIVGEVTGSYFGAQAVSGHDHDGDGVADLLVAAPLDSRRTTNGGAVFVFLDAAGLSGEVSASDADLEYTTNYGGAMLGAGSVGDANGDGATDLGFTLNISADEGPGGLLVAGVVGDGASSRDVVEVSFAQLWGGPFVFARAWDPDGDGTRSLLAASGGVHSFDLPLVGAVTPWDDATQSLEFAVLGSSVRWLRTDVSDYGGRSSFVAASPNYAGSAGVTTVQRAYWEEGRTIDEAAFLALGDAAGDRAGYSLDLLDMERDEVLDFVIGAPGADAGGAGAGAIYLVGGPR